MRLIFKYIAAGLLLAATFSANDIKNNAEAAIGNVFPGDVEYDLMKIEIPQSLKSQIEQEVRQRFFANEVYVWKISKGSSIAGYAVMDNVYGKSMPITFLVVFDKEFRILNSSIIKYREPYGGGVANENWNSQFTGKDSSSSFEVGKEISGISGATISVNSVSKGIRKLALLIPKISEQF